MDARNSSWKDFCGDLLHLFIDPICRYCRCGGANAGLCDECRDLLRSRIARCRRCALPLDMGTGQRHAHLTCGDCQVTPPPFTRSVCAYDYAEPVDGWINNFKHHRDLRDGTLLSNELIHQLRLAYDDAPLPDDLVAVPLHWRRQLRRGFNQACWIARHLHRALGIPVVQALRRSGSSHSQQGLNRKQRQSNLRQHFSVRSSAKIRGRHLALVDDVVTTGATSRALAEQLLDAGARRVDVWCLARTPRKR